MTPRLSFLIGGVQKAGTTALASYLSKHPRLRLPRGKEAHVFDAPEYPTGESITGIDALFEHHFDPDDWLDRGLVMGDATPITVLHPEFIRRVHGYNPAMRWIILLRDPVERAISQWHMEHARGTETWPMWAAFLFEPWRLSRFHDDFRWASPLRHQSYALRGRYANQIENVRALFPATSILLVSSEFLAASPALVVASIFRWLDLETSLPGEDYPRVFEGKYSHSRWDAVSRLLLRLQLGRDARFPGCLDSRVKGLEFLR